LIHGLLYSRIRSRILIRIKARILVIRILVIKILGLKSVDIQVKRLILQILVQSVDIL
jgi:hypothetical protein